MNEDPKHEHYSTEIAELLLTTKVARDATIRDLDELRKLIKRVYLLIIASCAVLLFVTLYSFHEVDYLSCARSNTVRHFQRGNVQYALNAAQVRQESARHEQRRDPGQAAIDRRAARKFIKDAAQAEISDISCSGLFPSET